jgi:hypothetical protein
MIKMQKTKTKMHAIYNERFRDEFDFTAHLTENHLVPLDATRLLSLCKINKIDKETAKLLQCQLFLAHFL